MDPTPKFWAKMVVVGIACLNALAAHRLVFPLIEETAASGTGRLLLRARSARLAAASAAVSGVSWAGALVLGGWRGLTLGMVPILAVYAGVLVGAVLVSTILVAPRVFVFAPASARLQRRIPLRELPVAVAYAVALTIAEAALATATRLRRRGGWREADGAAAFAGPMDGSPTGWEAIDDPWDQWHRSGWPRSDIDAGSKVAGD